MTIIEDIKFNNCDRYKYEMNLMEFKEILNIFEKDFRFKVDNKVQKVDFDKDILVNGTFFNNNNVQTITFLYDEKYNTIDCLDGLKRLIVLYKIYKSNIDEELLKNYRITELIL